MTEPTTFTLQVGRLQRGAVRRALKSGAIEWGVDLELEEDKGFLGSLFILKLRGSDANVYGFCSAVAEMAAEHNGR